MGSQVMRDPCLLIHESWGIEEFQTAYPDLRITHGSDCGLSFIGELSFRAALDGYEEIDDTYSLRGVVERGFPTAIPLVFETRGRIPKNFHTNPDEDLCLGSPLGLRIQLEAEPTLPGFIENIAIPYLYNHSHWETYGILPLGELEHGGPGLVADYERIFKVTGAKSCIGMLSMLGTKKRIANKQPCPCGSGERLGRCHNSVLNPLRGIDSRNFFRDQIACLRS